MIVYVIFLVLLLIIFFWLILTNPAHKTAAFMTRAVPPILIVTGVLLILIRRGVIGIPLVLIGLSWMRRIRSTHTATFSGGNKSTVRSKNIEMELDHDTGEMDGSVLTGIMKGARLSSLTKQEILSIYQETNSDVDSAALLASFLDRYHPDWREHSGSESFNEQHGTAGFDTMTRQEACQILGIEPDASKQEILQAWRHLIKRVHPDSGGSAFLTAKINAAKDVLLN